MGSCDPIILVGDLDEHQRYSVNGDRLPDNAPAIPCGLTAKYAFTDKFHLVKVDKAGNQKPIEIDEKNIAWQADIDTKFKNVEDLEVEPEDTKDFNYKQTPKSWKDVQWMDMESEHLMVWIKSAILP
jgi:hypothetical protein